MSAAGRLITDRTIRVGWKGTAPGRFGHVPRTRLQSARLRHLEMPSGWSRDTCRSARSSSRISSNAEDHDLLAHNRPIALIDVDDPTESADYSAGCAFSCGILPGERSCDSASVQPFPPVSGMPAQPRSPRTALPGTGTPTNAPSSATLHRSTVAPLADNRVLGRGVEPSAPNSTVMPVPNKRRNKCSEPLSVRSAYLGADRQPAATSLK